jgi:hypothetical protein
MIILAHRGSPCTKFHAAWWTCWFFALFHLESCVCPFAISQWIRQRNSIQFCANLRKSVTETLAMIRQVFGEGSMSRARKVQTHRDRKWRDRWRVKSRARSSYSLTSQRIRPSRPNSQFRILLWRFMATALKCAKTSPRTLTTKELAVA